jgi:hypothetical protein
MYLFNQEECGECRRRAFEVSTPQPVAPMPSLAVGRTPSRARLAGTNKTVAKRRPPLSVGQIADPAETSRYPAGPTNSSVRLVVKSGNERTYMSLFDQLFPTSEKTKLKTEN